MNRNKLSRRKFLATSATLAGGAVASRVSLTESFAQYSVSHSKKIAGNTQTHPRMFLTAEKINGLRSLTEAKAATQVGHGKKLWDQILKKANDDLNREPLTPASIFAGRNLSAAKHNNADFTICYEAGQRILRGALINLITGEDAFKQNALHQMSALFDDKLWLQWLDQAHERFGHPAGLRTGMLSQDVGLAFDWLYPALTEKERAFITDGLDRKGIQPFLTSLEQDPWWSHDLNNWYTVIIGGLGIAGMALGDNHPQAKKLIEYSLPKMEKYLSIYGPDGEFNESVGYASATRIPTAYFLAQYYWSQGDENRLAQPPFPQTCEWTMYFTVPPGNVAAFGDSHTDHPVEARYFSAIASATRNGILQWFYLQHTRGEASPLQFLWYDATLDPVDPQGKQPLGKVFYAHGANFSSRTSWNPNTTDCMVYGKSGREENHEHNDIGQVCIDGYGERLIVDLGSPSSYPADFFDEGRWQYYNASIKGHNILMFGDREMKISQRSRGEKYSNEFAAMNGKILATEFDDERGGYWRIDTTNAYDGVKSVRRTVVHLLPGIIAVLDEATLEQKEEISLRWHTAARCSPDVDGSFIVLGEQARLSGRIINTGVGQINVMQKEHRYEPPYHLDRLGEPLERRRESYIETTLMSDSCRLLSLFSVYHSDADRRLWHAGEKNWYTQTENGLVEVSLSNHQLVVKNVEQKKNWQVDLNG